LRVAPPPTPRHWPPLAVRYLENERNACEHAIQCTANTRPHVHFIFRVPWPCFTQCVIYCEDVLQHCWHFLVGRGEPWHLRFTKKIPTRCKSVSKFYFIFIWSSTCFGRHIVHHEEPKTALAAFGFANVEGCWVCSCWTLSASSNYIPNNPPRASAVLGSWWWVVCRPKHVELHINMK
jgi:hypothetical protein